MNSLRIKLFLILFVILLVTIGVNNAISAYVFQQEYSKAVENEMMHISKNIKQQLERILSIGINIRDVYDFDAVIEEMIAKYPEVSYAFVMDRSNNLLFHGGDHTPASIWVRPADMYQIIHHHTEKSIEVTVNDQSYYAAAAPILNEYEVVQGSVIIAVSHEYIADKTNGLLYSSILQAVGFFLISLLLLSLILTRWVTQPLMKIIDVMKAAGEGDLTARAEVTVKNEFAVLGTKLNKMLEQIKELMKSREQANRLQVQYAQEQERRRLSELLRQSLYTLNSTLDEDQVRSLVLEQMKLFLSFDRASIWLYDEHRTLNLSAMEHVDTIELEAGGDDGVLAALDAERVRSLAAHFAANPSLEFYMDQACNVHMMLIPAYLQQQLAGVVLLERRSKAFEQTEVDYILTFTSQAGIAISNAMMYRQMEKMAVTDELTRLYNRRYFYRLVQQAFDHAQQHDEPLSVIIFDLDYFKQINDRYGHFVGDEVLRRLADRLRSLMPPDSVTARFGGEEFICLLPNTGVDQAMMIAERLRETVASEGFATSAGSISVTMSIGIAGMHRSDEMDSFLQRADEALYQAKENGRNQIVYKD
jgi:diguanylate cyclase (GGDEF)-like protein